MQTEEKTTVRAASAAKDALGSYHPAVTALFLGAALLFTMLFLHPVTLVLSFAGALLYASLLAGWDRVRRGAAMWAPFLILVLLSNPLLTHRGITPLFILPTGNAVTAESMLFGAASTLMLASVLLWLFCLRTVMGADKWISLFGRIVPALSLLLSMAFRQVPRVAARVRDVRAAQPQTEKKSFLGGVRQMVRVLSAVTTWMLEESVDRSDAMLARGYGLPGRTSFDRFRFLKRDARMLLLWAALIGGTAAAAFAGAFSYWYYPAVRPLELTAASVPGFLCLAAVFFLPAALHMREERRWKT
ncbi:MAG: energy-coupling factor transporter transmembrane protein EcfT [Lachnospiraceae bacterium]|nr:energy-coupling factor transporter transmembrane protein EcfT [Lachnospiraceae bacterium]